MVECGLVVGDKDQSERQAIGHWESIWAWEFASIVIPLVESLVVKFPPLNKLVSIGNNIFPLVAIDVHAIFQPFVSPVKFLQPADGSLL